MYSSGFARFPLPLYMCYFDMDRTHEAISKPDTLLLSLSFNSLPKEISSFTHKSFVSAYKVWNRKRVKGLRSKPPGHGRAKQTLMPDGRVSQDMLTHAFIMGREPKKISFANRSKNDASCLLDLLAFSTSSMCQTHAEKAFYLETISAPWETRRSEQCGLGVVICELLLAIMRSDTTKISEANFKRPPTAAMTGDEAWAVAVTTLHSQTSSSREAWGRHTHAGLGRHGKLGA